MRRLSSWDAASLAVEGRSTVLTISALAVLEGTRADGTPLTRDVIAEHLQQRMHLLAPLRWTLAPTPFKIAHPVWIDGDVDLDFHVREIGLPPPGDIDQLETMVAGLVSHPMDRSRPLWEVHVIDGLPDDEVAVLTKIHHAAFDGKAAVELLGLLFDLSPHGRTIPPAPPHSPEQRPGDATLLVKGAAEAARQAIKAPKAAATSLTYIDHNFAAKSLPGAATVGRAARRAQSLGGDDPVPPNASAHKVPRTPFNGAIKTNRRSFKMVALPLESVKAVKNKYQCTVNDVVMALSAGALRGWLESTGDLPAIPLMAAVPIALPGDAGAFGNSVGVLQVPLPTDEPDAEKRLMRCREEMRRAKEIHNALPATLLMDSVNLIPPMLYGRATRALVEIGGNPRFALNTNVAVSNIPGPPIPMYLAGAQLKRLSPVSVVLGTVGLNITIISYNGDLEFGLIADASQVPDLSGLAQGLRDELDALLQAAALTEGDS